MYGIADGGLRWALYLGRGLPGAIDDLSVDP